MNNQQAIPFTVTTPASPSAPAQDFTVVDLSEQELSYVGGGSGGTNLL